VIGHVKLEDECCKSSSLHNTTVSTLLTFPNQEAIYKIDSRNVTTIFLLPSNIYLEPVVKKSGRTSWRDDDLTRGGAGIGMSREGRREKQENTTGKRYIF
jgi:hypothetical protein